jgi:hypothetical protein
MFRTTRYIKEYVEEFISLQRNILNIPFSYRNRVWHCRIPAQEIAPLFKDAIAVQNIHLPARFWDILETSK